MGIEFVWDESFSVGNREIDRQHQRMFELASALPETLDEMSIKRTLMTLYRHTREHFTAEERMMKEIGYPKLAEHRNLHDALITKLNAISVRSFDSDESVMQFKRFVYDWVIDHIMHYDKDYFRFSQERRVVSGRA